MKNTGNNRNKSRYLVFTDLDGTLLDHFDYGYQPAKPALETLASKHIPVIFCTSKTFTELLEIRSELQNEHPFIVENGAAIYFPEGYFPDSILASTGKEIIHNAEGFACIAFSQPREYWASLLKTVKPEFRESFTTFSEMGVEGIIKATGLDKEKAEKANTRGFSEPVLWNGNSAEKRTFIEHMNHKGANVLEGGRFLHVSGHCDKGKALVFLHNLFEKQYDCEFLAIAAGDSNNDKAMLEAADMALVVRSPVHEPPGLANKPEITYTSNATGPAGWSEGISALLAS